MTDLAASLEPYQLPFQAELDGQDLLDVLDSRTNLFFAGDLTGLAAHTATYDKDRGYLDSGRQEVPVGLLGFNIEAATPVLRSLGVLQGDEFPGTLISGGSYIGALPPDPLFYGAISPRSSRKDHAKGVFETKVDAYYHDLSKTPPDGKKIIGPKMVGARMPHEGVNFLGVSFYYVFAASRSHEHIDPVLNDVLFMLYGDNHPRATTVFNRIRLNKEAIRDREWILDHFEEEFARMVEFDGFKQAAEHYQRLAMIHFDRNTARFNPSRTVRGIPQVEGVHYAAELDDLAIKYYKSHLVRVVASSTTNVEMLEKL